MCRLACSPRSSRSDDTQSSIRSARWMQSKRSHPLDQRRAEFNTRRSGRQSSRVSGRFGTRTSEPSQSPMRTSLEFRVVLEGSSSVAPLNRIRAYADSYAGGRFQRAESNARLRRIRYACTQTSMRRTKLSFGSARVFPPCIYPTHILPESESIQILTYGTDGLEFLKEIFRFRSTLGRPRATRT